MATVARRLVGRVREGLVRLGPGQAVVVGYAAVALLAGALGQAVLAAAVLAAAHLRRSGGRTRRGAARGHLDVPDGRRSALSPSPGLVATALLAAWVARSGMASVALTVVLLAAVVTAVAVVGLVALVGFVAGAAHGVALAAGAALGLASAIVRRRLGRRAGRA
jgi:hypothetical protein